MWGTQPRELKLVLHDNLGQGAGWGMGGREIQEGGNHVHLWLIHDVVQQKTTQHCKTKIKLKILI